MDVRDIHYRVSARCWRCDAPRSMGECDECAGPVSPAPAFYLPPWPTPAVPRFARVAGGEDSFWVTLPDGRELRASGFIVRAVREALR
jgi:hypothetical protein